MISLILQTISRYHLPLLLLFSFFLLLRGHNQPGGGFIGGLVASTGWVLYAIAFDPGQARRVLPVEPHWLIGARLLLALGSGTLPLLGGWPLLTASWLVAEVPGLGTMHLGTPLAFDLGVYMLVIGAVLTIILAMAEE